MTATPEKPPTDTSERPRAEAATLSPKAGEPRWDTVALVGVGLIGASIGLALRQRGLARQVVGVGHRQQTLDEAVKLGAIDSWSLDLLAGVADAELVVFCTPVGRIAEQAIEAAEAAQRGALFTDAGSTKERIVADVEAAVDSYGQLARGVRFVGSHPLAGSEKRGPAAARADLFVGKKAVVTPTRLTSLEDQQAVEQFWQALGAETVEMLPWEHDAALADTSHIPHLIAALLCNTTESHHLPLVGGGWLDTTRIAGGGVEMWSQIVAANRPNIAGILARFASSLDELRAAIDSQNDAQLHKILEDAQIKRNSVGN